MDNWLAQLNPIPYMVVIAIWRWFTHCKKALDSNLSWTFVPWRVKTNGIAAKWVRYVYFLNTFLKNLNVRFTSFFIYLFIFLLAFQIFHFVVHQCSVRGHFVARSVILANKHKSMVQCWKWWHHAKLLNGRILSVW